MNRQKSFLLLLIAIVLATCFVIIRPFLGYILTGLILAFLLYPLKKRFDRSMKSTYSSALVVMITVFGAILPLILMTGIIANDAAQLAGSMNQTSGNQNQTQTNQSGSATPGISGLSDLEQQIESITGSDFSLQERASSVLQSVGGAVVSSASQIVGMASNVAIGLSLLLFTQFYGLKDGKRTVNWTEDFGLMPTDIQKDLYRDTAKTVRAVVKGHIFVAIATGILTGIGLFLTGVPTAFFWTFIAMLSGLIPIVGTALVWVPAAAYLLLTGSTVSAGLLVLYGMFVIGSADNFLRPYLVDEDADVHPLYILLGVIGGIGLFGAIGIFVGPVIFGLAKSLLNIYQDNLERFA